MFGQQPYGMPYTNPAAGYVNPYQARLDALQQPQMQPQMQPTAQPQQIIRVTGIDGAKAYQMPPNSAVTLFDANEDIFFLKSTDGAGFPTIRSFRFAPIEAAPAPAEFITRAEFDQFKEALLNGKQLVQPAPAAGPGAGPGANVGTIQPPATHADVSAV